MPAVVDIYNMALDMLDEGPVVDPTTDTRRSAKAVARQYPECVKELLRAHPWQFAKARASLAASSTAPAFDWLRAFPLPADFIRLVPLTKTGVFEGRPFLFEIEGGEILTDEPAPLKIRYIRSVTDPLKFDPLFTRALAAKLAMYIAHSVTGKRSYVSDSQQIYNMALIEAQRISSMEQKTERAFDSEWIDARII